MFNPNLIHECFIKPLQESQGDRTLLIIGEKAFTFAQLFARIKQAAAHQSLQELMPGDLVALSIQDPLDTVVMIFALIYRGLIPCVLNPNAPISGYEPALKKANCRAVIRQVLLSELDPGKPLSHPVAFALFTSGTTGQPTLVFHRHVDPLLMNTHYGKEVIHLTETDRLFTTSRFYFAYGLNALFFALLNRAQLVILPDEITPESVIRCLSTLAPTVFFSVPTLYKRLLPFLPEPTQFNSLRLCISAGENLPLPIFESWHAATGLSILDGIGTTEVLSTFISNRLDTILPGSTGIPVPGFKAQIRDPETGVPLNAGEIGVLWIKGETYLPFYPNNEAETVARFQDGWFKTNDLFSVNPQGFYFYHGRANDLFKVSGIWIYPYKIEGSLAAHPAVNEVIVSGVQDADGLMRIEARVHLNESYTPDEELTKALKSWTKERLSRHEYPHFIHYVDAIPKTPSGKMIRRTLVC